MDGSLFRAQETVTTHRPASRPLCLSPWALISSLSISVERLKDGREAGTGLGRWGSRGLGRGSSWRGRGCQWQRGACPSTPSPLRSCAHLWEDAQACPGPAFFTLSGRGSASPETQTGKLLGKWGQDWVSPGSAHGARILPTPCRSHLLPALTWLWLALLR